MCGPIALSIPANSNNDIKQWISISKYLIGKTITYVFLGMIFGLIGKQIIISGFQQWLSIITGITLLIITILILLQKNSFHTNLLQTFISNKLIPVLSKALKSSSPFAPLYIGILNGLLPCGLVYIGLIGSTASGSLLSGGIFMLVFSIGTFPIMFSFLALAKKLSFSIRNTLQKAGTWLIAVVAILLILRGMNLNIPYISPDLKALNAHPHEAIGCHP